MTTQGAFIRLWNRRRIFIIIGLINLLYFFTYFQRVAIPGTIFNELQKDLGLSSVQVAFLGGIFLYIYGGMQLINGLLVDRIGTAKVIIIGGVLLSIGSVLFPLSHSLFALYFSRAIVGLGASVVFLCMIKELDIQFSNKNFTVALSISILIGFSGGLLGTKPFAIAVESYGWRYALLGIGIACSLVIFITYFFVKDLMKRPTQYPAIMPLPALKEVLSNRLIYPPMFSSAVIFSIYFLMQSTIGKKFLEDCCHIRPEKSASYTFIMMLASIIMSFLNGFIPKLIANRRKPIMLLLNFLNISAIIMAIFIALGNTHLIMPCFIAWGMSASGMPIFSTTIKELNEPKYAGTSIGFSNAVCYIFVAIIVTLTGYILDIYSKSAIKTATAIHYPPNAYIAIFIFALVLGFASLISSCYARETAGNNITNLATVDQAK